jgi:CheY-like chemotaxis protein
MSTAVSNILDQQAPRLLVVDDEPIILDCFWQFALCRVDAITTTTGIETIQAAYQHNPGSHYNGRFAPLHGRFEVVQQLRNNGFHTPVTFLTARVTMEDRERAQALGSED